MYQIKTFNEIAQEGMNRFESENYSINIEGESPHGILLRSQKLHDYEFPKSVLGVARAGAGTNNVPVDELTKQGIVVFNTPGANANAVKELVIASLLLSVRPILEGANWIQNQEGENLEEIAEANKKQFAGTELEGKRLGIIGLGAIGAVIANDAYRLGMEVVGYDPYVSVDTAWTISRRVKRAQNVEEIFKTCDFITIHVPLNDATRNLVSEKELRMMKNTAKLFNFSRGEIVDTAAVLDAINAHEIAGFTTDFADASLLNNPNILVLPHLGASTEEAEVNCAKMAARTLKRFLETGVIKRSVNFPTVEMDFQSPYRVTIFHDNQPNVLGQISTEIARLGINIENMINRGRGDYAYTLVDVSETDDFKMQRVKRHLEQKENLIRVRTIKNSEVYNEWS